MDSARAPGVQVREVKPAYLAVAEKTALALAPVLLGVEPREDVVTVLLCLISPQAELVRSWMTGLPRAVVRDQIVGPELLADLDGLAQAGERPVLILLYEDMAKAPVSTMAAGLSVSGFRQARGDA